MASILVCSNTVYAHVHSALAVARHLAASGHRVRFLTGKPYEEAVARADGVEFVPLTPEAGPSIDDPNASFPERVGLTGLAAARFDIENIFLRPGPHQLAAIDEALAAEPADVVLAEASFVGAVLLAARSSDQRPAVVTLGIFPLALPSPDTAPPGMGLPPLAGPLNRPRNRVLNAAVDRLVFAQAREELHRLFRATGAAVDLSLLDAPVVLPDAYLQFTVPGFEYPRRHLPGTVRFVGPLPAPQVEVPLPDWWGDLDGGRRVVHVTQGTVANKDRRQLIEPAIAALEDRDELLVVVSMGGRGAGELPGPLPANVRVAEYLPHDLLLPRTSVMVTNGGYGGVHRALAHGVPLVVAGATEDKLEVGARVAWSGAGVNLRTNTPRPERLRDAVRRVLTQRSYRDAAARLSAEIARAPGLAGVDEVIAEQLAVRR
ncbi:glycosyltransferase [Naasia sp. SYSU D00057]|uniref:nucleotide disphospho-sugar-binding domain-containing protein n=1 Tax=Naasia sp. SYSU D00057 TaxID=2817380 RepID=UPI001B3052B4|nr:glycosyltransferase [Naasia sp. SYSU D00057]